MSQDVRRELSNKYCPRFGQLAVEFGFISERDLTDALACQVHEELSGRPHRLLGAILFEKERMAADQIDLVLNELFRRIRREAAADLR